LKKSQNDSCGIVERQRRNRIPIWLSPDGDFLKKRENKA
jgi:hypothetical protein